jgi:flagellar basal body rod protein FlgC
MIGSIGMGVGSVTGLAAPASGMRAASARLEASAHEVATATTPGAGPAPLPDGAVTGVQGADLVGEVVNHIAALAAYRANAGSFRAADAMTEALLDIVA